MATTVQISTPKHSRVPAYSPCPVVLTPASGAAAECNFRYVVEVWVSFDSYSFTPGTYEKVATLKQYPSPRGAGEFDVHRVVESYLSHHVNPDLVGAERGVDATSGRGMYCWVSLRGGCEYSDPSCTDPVVYYPNQDTFDALFWNGALQWEEPFADYTAYDWYLTTGPYPGPRRFLTDLPRAGVTVRAGCSAHLASDDDSFFTLSYHDFGDVPVAGWAVTTYDSSGATIQAAAAAWTALNPSVGADVQQVGCGPYNLNRSFLVAGSQPVVSPDTAYYDFALTDGAGNTISETVRFVVDRRPVPEAETRVCWVNRWGGIDHFDFPTSRKDLRGAKRGEYERVRGAWDAGSGQWTHATGAPFGGDRGRTTLSVAASTKLTLTTGYITDAEHAWLTDDLFSSPAVWVCDWTDGDYLATRTGLRLVPCTVSSASAEARRAVRGARPVQFSVELTVAHDRAVQRG